MSSTQLQIALSGALPALVAMWLVDRLDAKRPEPASLRRKVAFFGALCVVPAIVLEALLSNHVGVNLDPEFTYQGASFKAFVVAAGVEEACKMFVVYWIVWR
ncbi:MAG TPA: PrsW family glutamic-type intramembrane protease, partial [Kofleriaceae bacterium]|nr:PrsW family glutamic-type intramembrane protease [Kofleriaceae bacterium]